MGSNKQHQFLPPGCSKERRVETHPGRGNNLGYFVLLGTHMFEPRVTALWVTAFTPWKYSSRGSQGCFCAHPAPQFQAPSLLCRAGCSPGVLLQQVPSHPQVTPGEDWLGSGVSARLGSPTGLVGWGL